MRRKSTRNVRKTSPEKPVKETETPPKTRRSKRRKRSPSKSTDSDEALSPLKHAAVEETPDTTTKSHTPSDEETSQEAVWKVTSSDDTPKGEIKKLKICLTRPITDSPDKGKSRRSKSNSHTEDDATSSEDKSTTRRTRSRGSPYIRNDGFSSQEADEEVEEKKGKGKSKGKHKSKIEKSAQLNEPATQTNSEISENVQVTAQSPSIDKPVDNENDYNKVDADDIQNVKENVEIQEDVCEERADDSETVKSASNSQPNENENCSKSDKRTSDSDDDDEPLSVIKEHSNQAKHTVPENVDEDKKINDDTNETEDSSVTVDPEITKDDEQETVAVPEVTQDTQQIVEEQVEDIAVPNVAKEIAQNVSENQQQQGMIIDEEESVEKVQIESQVEIPGDVAEPQSNIISEEKSVLPVEEKSTESVEEISAHPIEEISVQPMEENVATEDVEMAEAPQSCEKTAISDEIIMDNSQTTESISPEEIPVVDNKRSPRRKLVRDNIIQKVEPKEVPEEDDQTESTARRIKLSNIKRNWYNDISLVKIDLETLQTLCPTIEFPKEPDLALDSHKERRRSSTSESTTVRKIERKVSVEYKTENSTSDKPAFEKQTSVGSTTQDSEDNSNIIAFNRKISIVDDTASKLKPPPSPAKNPVSDVLYITNLVRPFTIKQLKELLERTGQIKEEGFWTDRIKSKCYVQYESTEDAEATRNALHGVQWPIGNGKKLIIDYGTPEDIENAKNPPLPPQTTATPPETVTAVKENVEPVVNKLKDAEASPNDMEKKRSDGPMREWDIGKKDVHRERSRSRGRSRKHRRSPSPTDDFISRKQKKVEEAVPQKLMDDLFLKTKATPSIYWQPLSPEEISMKQQQRLIRMEEHKRRIEENSRVKGRDGGRGAFRRRYD